MNNSIELKVIPDWEEIEKTRKNFGQFLKEHGLIKDLINSQEMVLSELLENSIKYGNFKKSGSNIIINLFIDRSIIIIEVNNPIDDKSAEHLKRLDKTIQWIRGYQDSFEAYTEKLKEISKRSFEDEESCLGLARIAYEGKAILDFYVLEDQLNVSAISKVERF